MIKLSETTLKRKLWLIEATKSLTEYRAPGTTITDAECKGLMEYLDLGYSPYDAADAYQAKTAK